MAKQYGFLIDTDRCAQCHACETACKAYNGIELGVKWRHVVAVWTGSYPKAAFKSVSTACMHCAAPACIGVCPKGAISKRAEDGIVVVDKTKCIGCHACESACPYGAPQFGKDGLMQKCNLCVDRVAQGLKPACVSTCPANALMFGTLDELPKLAGKKTVKLLAGATQPSVYVLAKQ
jgi:anaerobic dimethyl sulfoxide reductase subunit B